MLRILGRLASDVVVSAAWSAIERVHEACERVLFTDAQIAANKRARCELDARESCDRYMRRAQERRMAS
jgi:hypothetical protein